MKEEWRPVILGKLRQPGRYEVSNRGRVRNIETRRILQPYLCPTRNGLYLKVDLRQDGRRYQSFVHRLVASAFCPNPEGKPEINHGDMDNLNNRAGNLEWATRLENEQHKKFMEATV